MGSARGLAILLACLLAGGCGTSDRAHDAAAVTERFQAALEAEDGAAACGLLAPETRSKLEQEEMKSCDEAILELDLPTGAPVAETSVYVTNAAVSLAEEGKTFLSEFEDGWKVSAAGCTPTAPDLPYDCELEG